MDIKALLDAREAYLATPGIEHYDETLQAVVAAADSTGSLGKADIGALVLWKRLRADTPWATALQQRPEGDVRAITAMAIEAVRDQSLSLEEAGRRGRQALLGLPGCGHGPALASAILLAGAPTRMAVYDRHAEAGLRMLGLPSGGSYATYMANLGTLVDGLAAEGHDWTPRDVDTALFAMGRQQARR